MKPNSQHYQSTELDHIQLYTFWGCLEEKKKKKWKLEPERGIKEKKKRSKHHTHHKQSTPSLVMTWLNRSRSLQTLAKSRIWIWRHTYREGVGFDGCCITDTANQNLMPHLQRLSRVCRGVAWLALPIRDPNLAPHLQGGSRIWGVLCDCQSKFDATPTETE